MDRLHVDTASLIRVALNGRAADREAFEISSHLEVCARCRALLDALPPEARRFYGEAMPGDPERSNPGGYDPSSYDGALDSVFEKLVEESSHLDRERAVAPSLLAELSGLPTTQQALRIRNTARFHSWGLAEYLLERSRAAWTEDPAQAEQWAGLAHLVAEQLEASGFREKVRADLQSEIWSCIANCRRILTDFRGAGDAFRRAEELLARGTGDPMEHARLLDLKSSYVRELHDFENAERLLSTAIRTYRYAGESHLEGRALLKLAKLHGDAGRPELALPVLEDARELVDTEGEPWLTLLVHMTLVYHLNEVGRAEEAHAHLPRLRELARAHGNRLDRLRVLWIEGLVCQRLGKTALAEEALKQVRAGFIDARIGYDVALVSLDLAALYLEAGRTAEVKGLASEMLPQFAARQIQREAMLALSLFEQAARKEQATLALVERVASRVERVRGSRGAPEV
jgi:tetratricopeptide (TPR) repeat protein